MTSREQLSFKDNAYHVRESTRLLTNVLTFFFFFYGNADFRLTCWDHIRFYSSQFCAANNDYEGLATNRYVFVDTKGFQTAHERDLFSMHTVNPHKLALLL